MGRSWTLKSSENRMSWEDAVKWMKSQPDQTEVARDCFFDDPLSEAANRYYLSSEWSAVRELIGTQGGRALDIGSGRGISAYALAMDGWQVTALEPDPSLLVGAGAIRQLARDTKLEIDVVVEWGEQLPFESNSFDLVFCRQVLHHARDLKDLCREAGRVLKPNGLFIAIRDHVVSRHEDLPAFLGEHSLHRLYGGEHAFTLKEYKSAIIAAGIDLKQVLNPMESEINMYPRSKQTLKDNMASKLHLPSSALIPDWLLSWRGRTSNAPGRLYSFVGRKPGQ